MMRVWYRCDGVVDSCKVDVGTKIAARKLVRKLLPSAKIGFIEKV